MGESIERIVAKAPRLARAIAVLNMPLGRKYLKIVDKKQELASYNQWEGAEKITIETSAGPFLTANVRRYVLMTTSEEESRIANNDCANMILDYIKDFSSCMNEKLNEKLVYHLISARRTGEALKEISNLFNKYKLQNQPFAILAMVEKIGSLNDKLPQELDALVGWAYRRKTQLKKQQQ